MMPPQPTDPRPRKATAARKSTSPRSRRDASRPPAQTTAPLEPDATDPGATPTTLPDLTGRAADSHPFTRGEVVEYESTDPLTGAEIAGLGIVAQTFTFGEGDDVQHRVAVARLSSDLFLDAAAVKATNNT